MIERALYPELLRSLSEHPAVALIGARQVGKTTLAKATAERFSQSTYLDLERPADLAKLADPELFLERHRDHLVVLDEVQHQPGLFPVLRGIIDRARRPGRFLLTGSASPELLRQTSESLAGRIIFHELAPFDLREIRPQGEAVYAFWLRGGFPPSWLAASDEASLTWREAFIRTYLERDIPAFGIRVPATTLRRFWQMLAHAHGQLWNASRLAAAFGVSHPTVQRYLDILEATFMVRRLLPWRANVGKRLTKSPKVYVRDSGLLHALLGVPSLDALYGHPAVGASWEGWVIEQLASMLGPRWQMSFYRTAAGAELDVVAEAGRKRIGFEIKFSSAPALSKGFWQALADVQPQKAYVIAPVESPYPLAENVEVLPISALTKVLEGI